MVDGALRAGLAAQRLELSRRQLERLARRYKAVGAGGLISRQRSRTSNLQLASSTAKRVVALIQERYADFGPTLACEKLRECPGLTLAKETGRVLMVSV